MDNTPATTCSPTRTAVTFQGADAPSEEQYLFCIRCGLCLSACPTYKLSLKETDSPRARVTLVRKVMEGELPLGTGFSQQMYKCLACLACDTICPVGIHPASLALAGRALAHEALPQPWFKRPIFRDLFPRPDRLELATLPLRLYSRLGLKHAVERLGLTRLLPAQLRDMERMLPPLPARPLRQTLPEVTPARGERKARVGFFLGCVQSLIFAEGSQAAVRVMAENGCEVVTPREVKCCGMPHVGYGDREAARELARHNVDLFEGLGVDVVVTDCATCGSTLKEYPELLAPDAAYAKRATAFAAKVRDVSEFLATLDLREPSQPLHRKVTVHDPCHLVRGQGVRAQPRQIIELAGAELVEMRDADVCCGSAGTKILTHYEASTAILDQKMANVAATGAEVVAAGCPGCQLHLKLGAQRAGLEIEVCHPVQLLDAAYRAEEPKAALTPLKSNSPPSPYRGQAGTSPLRARSTQRKREET
ncbi:MAG: (Fe-S)-binding protein [Anaerolineae bacterium]